MVFFHPESFFARSFLTSIRMQRLYLLLLSATETPYPPNRLLWWFLRRYLAQGFLLIWCADRDILVITSFLLKTGTAKVRRKRIKIPKMFIFVFFLFSWSNFWYGKFSQRSFIYDVLTFTLSLLLFSWVNQAKFSEITMTQSFHQKMVVTFGVGQLAWNKGQTTV